MLAVAARLKQLSHRYDLAVVVTNQATRRTATVAEAAAIVWRKLQP